MKKNIVVIILLLFGSIGLIQAQSVKFEKLGSGRPVIFIPGLGCPGDVWKDVTEDLSKDYECLLVNIAGFADGNHNVPFDMNKIKNDIVSYIHDNNLDSPIIIGHSIGGFISLSLASENKELFSKVIIIDSYPFALAANVPGITIEQAKSQATQIKNIFSQMDDAAFKTQQAAILNSGISDESKIAQVLDWMMKSNRTSIAQAMYDGLSTDLRPNLSLIHAPILVLGTWQAQKQLGRTKEITYNIFKEQYANAKESEIIISENSKHFIMYDDPQWLIANIKKFIEK